MIIPKTGRKLAVRVMLEVLVSIKRQRGTVGDLY